ncbi:protein suppressor of sable isoform X4 [Papilio machaon]|uniref:protein suppressor of sable isoform X4 n=1 Tax=Papilio machaon TaxID=76193 RepID=UPI001E662A75|nr:protein suppressor of sable isoform X4 [Papilio machaon]
MLIVSTNISASFTMAETAPNVLSEDLEDGEIESEGEEVAENVVTGKTDECNIKNEENQDIHKAEQQQFYYSKSGKKKKSKSHKGEPKFKDKNKKNRKYTSPIDDDFAGNIEKAIRKAMNKNEDNQGDVEDDVEERRKYKKRKKYDSKDGPGKKRKKQEYPDEMDESEMMCVRGASPVHKNSPAEAFQENDSSYASDSSQESRGPPQHRPQRQRPPQRERNKNNKNDRRRGIHPMQDPEGVCLYYMQGKCQKENTESQERSIPSLFELNIPIPQNSPDSFQMHQYNNERQKVSPKIRQSRWQNEGSNPNFGMNMSPNDLTKMGIENLDQLGQLTVLQLNSIGISLKQITEIQLNTMSIQKLGLINNVDQQAQAFVGPNAGAQDMDLRVPPVVQVSSNVPISADLPGQDIDMRFQPNVSLQKTEDPSDTTEGKSTEQNKDMIDIDQYTKDALKFALKDKENIDISNESFENEKSVPSIESKDVDHRVLPFANDDARTRHTKSEDKPRQAECDTDIRFLQPEPLFKNTEKRHRRSTTDDEDNNLLIDEKWYSSDEEKGSKKKSPVSSPKSLMSPPAPHIIEPSTVLSRLGDLSKIDISEEVTKLLNIMKNNTQDNKQNTADVSEGRISRDPRSRRSPDTVSDSGKTNKKSPRVSIYECIDGEPTDGRRRTDVDLRQADYKAPTFGDTDLRQSAAGDIDFRLGLPFKAIPNYTPASEINGSINSHPPISYKLVPIDIPRPDYTDIRNSTAKSQALQDPRLRKVFRLSVDESNSDSEKPPKVTSTAPRVDPRRKPKEPEIVPEQKSIDLQTILQNSNWYKELSSTQKIFVNQNLVPVTQMIKQYQQEKSSGKKFDLSSIQSNTVLCNIFTNLGVSLGENGEYSYLPKPKEALLKTPVNFSQGSLSFNMNVGGGMEPNMNMMNVPSMGMGAVPNVNNLNVGHMHNFNQPLSDPRGGPTPGLLGIAPNIPHNFNNSYGGPNNYGNNMSFNGPPQGNDFNYMDGDQNFQRFPNRGGHRGRGNDRWNRGGSGRGHRDRKNFNDRGNWKNDRH